MKDLFSKKAILKLREFNKKSSFSGNDRNGINIMWFNPNFSDEHRLKSNLKMHWHTFYEVHFMLEGFVTYQTKDEKLFTVKEGEFLFIPPGNEHIIINEGRTFKKFGLTFSCSDECNVKYIFKDEIFKGSGKGWIEHIFSTIAQGLETDNGTETCIVRNCVNNLILFMTEQIIDTSIDTSGISADERIIRVKRFIEDNSMRDISVEEAASFVYLSSKHLGRLFKKHTNMNISDFIEKSRCERAKMLLEDKSIPISEIAERLSFSNEYNFSRFFKRVEGFTPGTYREIKGR